MLNKLGLKLFRNNSQGNSKHPLCAEVIAHETKMERLTEEGVKNYGKIDQLELVQQQQHTLIIKMDGRTKRDKEEFDKRLVKGDEVIENLENNVAAIKTNIRLIATAVKVPKDELEE